MKKFLAILLVLTMVIGTGIMVSAVALEDMESITFVKKLEAQGVNPAETFNFTIGESRVRAGSAGSAPVLSNFSINVAQGASQGDLNLALPTFDHVGIYEYDIQEISGNTAGMTYDTAKRTLVVQVTNGEDGLIRTAYLKNADGEKMEEFVVANNQFKSGNLKLKKVIEGNLADQDHEFTVTVNLNSERNLNLAAMLAANNASISADKKTITYTVSGGSEFTIQNIPYDVSYEVAETGNEAYNPVYIVAYDTNYKGQMDAAEKSTTITNTRNTDIDTGISLDNLPYIMTMALALGGLVLFVVRKRRLN